MATACTTSTSTTTTVEGRHRFRVAGYSATRGAAPAHRVASGTFTVGGFDWVVVFYPEGVTAADMDYVSVYLELKDAAAGGATARVLYDLRLVHPATGEARSVRWLIDGSTSRVFSNAFPSWGHPRFMRRRELEEAGFVRDDRLTIGCVISVFQDPVVTAGDVPELEPPPSNILDHLSGLLDDKDTADVTFVVQGEEFVAHRAVLAMRSPVFKAEHYGQMKESTARIAVDGMEPAVFRALLHFICLVKKTTAAGEFVRSGTFAVGGYDWAVRYYPNGNDGDDEASRQPSVVLELMTRDAVATALYELKVVDQITGERLVLRDGKTAAFDTRNNQFRCSGVQFTSCNPLEMPLAFVAGDFLTIECIVTIVGEPRVSKTNALPPPPPPQDVAVDAQ